MVKTISKEDGYILLMEDFRAFNCVCLCVVDGHESFGSHIFFPALTHFPLVF